MGRERGLVGELEKNLAAGEQSLLFLNRRGFAPLTLCRTCGHRFQCPNCTAWMVEHRLMHRLACHHCGHVEPPPKACPECGEETRVGVRFCGACGSDIKMFEDMRGLCLSAVLPNLHAENLARSGSTSLGHLDAIREQLKPQDADTFGLIVMTGP